MTDYVYTILNNYYHALETVGYLNTKHVYKLLVVLFYYHMLECGCCNGISAEDRQAIEKALNCLYGSSCLIPFASYAKSDKQYLRCLNEALYKVNNGMYYHRTHTQSEQ